MRKLVLSAFALAAMTSFAMAGEPVKLTSSQLDAVSAGGVCTVAICANVNLTRQRANAYAIGVANVAAAANSNTTVQFIGD